MRVAVVGAGFAGLAAAEALTHGGIDVVVLEARDRVGGRVWSRNLPDGSVIELGAEFVLPGNDLVRATAARLGLELCDKQMYYGDREPRGVAVDAAQLELGVLALRESLAVSADSLDAISAAGFLAGLDLHPAVRETVLARAEVSCATSAEDVRASALAHLAALSREPCPSVRGGNDLIAKRLAAALGDTLRLGSPVRRIEWQAHGARVVGDTVDLTVDRVVLSLPASVVGRIDFEPALPADLQTAYARVRYGHAAKLFVPLATTPAPSAVLSVPERYWTWTAAGGDGVQPVLNAFAGSRAALERLRVDDGPSTWLESVAHLRPDLALRVSEAVLSTWDDDPWVGAAYSCDAPDVSAWGPSGPFHVAGEHTGGPFSALMEGALRSGVRVAGEILGGAS